MMRFLLRKPKKRIRKNEKFIKAWHELQAQLKDKSLWSKALIDADKLLDKALKKRRFKGKSMGERLANAQRFITDNDDIWDAHNLVKKLLDAPEKVKLREHDVKEAIISFREALKDIGALPENGEKDKKT
jgi:predicted metal-dependent hydrolase